MARGMINPGPGNIINRRKIRPDKVAGVSNPGQVSAASFLIPDYCRNAFLAIHFYLQGLPEPDVSEMGGSADQLLPVQNIPFDKGA